MNKLVAAVFLAFVAVASAGLVPDVHAVHAFPAPVLGAPLLPKVRYNAPEVSVVKQPVTVHEPEVHYRNVPVPYSVPYAVPYSVPYAVPVAHHGIAHPVVGQHLAYGALGAQHLAYGGLGAPIVKIH